MSKQKSSNVLGNYFSPTCFVPIKQPVDQLVYRHTFNKISCIRNSCYVYNLRYIECDQNTTNVEVTMALGFSINQLVSFILVATFTFTVWHSTFELTKYTIQNWDSLSLSNLLLIIKKLTSSPGLLLLHSYLSVSIIMKILVAVTILVVYFVVQLDAFIRAPYPRRARAIRQGIIRPNAARLTSDFTHEDIIWTLRPPEGTPLWKRFGLRFGSNIIRLEAIVRGRDPPFCLCPKGGQAIIHAVYNGT